ncbi:hypothetical protein TEA_007191 [Camellia sinensis var. sinensis]|uniref:Uncharacterized protein n=1 Tax=Camellia sinensis var. sinensis TaxID=542762 RepID=A0A4S4ET98_CAMSN|nr:hypothetical protein TEA_007191 [Camellia sinensis var. sinensis]
MLKAFLNDGVDPASQLLVRYNGSEESSERTKTPALVPEDADPICGTCISILYVKQYLFYAFLFSSAFYMFSQSPYENFQDDQDRPNQRHKKRAVSNQDRPPSITDIEPKEAYQMPPSDSDSE